MIYSAYLGSAEKVFRGGRVWASAVSSAERVWGVGFGRELSVRPSVRLSSRRSLTPRSERVWGVGKWEE